MYVYAAGNNYCDCSVGMSQYGQHLGNWTEKHTGTYCPYAK